MAKLTRHCLPDMRLESASPASAETRSTIFLYNKSSSTTVGL